MDTRVHLDRTERSYIAPASQADMIRAVPEGLFDLLSLYEKKIILAYSNTFDAEVCNTFCATVQMKSCHCGTTDEQFLPALIPSFIFLSFFLCSKSCTFMPPPHHKHVYDKFIIAAPNRRVGVCHTEAEEAIIGIPTSVCQPALSPLVRVRVDKESAKRFQSHIPHFSSFFFFAACDEKKARCVCACVCVFWISVLLHNKSLLNKCKADGTMVSPP